MARINYEGIPKELSLMDCEPVSGPRARRILCYPSNNGRCKNLAHTLELSGVKKICFVGTVYLPGGIKVLGKGHSSIVVAALLWDELSALKILRSDSKRESLLLECRNLSIAGRYGATPRPYVCEEEFIVMELVWGKSLLELIEESTLNLNRVIEALEAAYTLDVANILHKELHRPWRNVFYPFDSRKALIIDLESSTRGCGNVARLAQAIYLKTVGGLEDEFLRILKGYKQYCSRHYFNKIVREFALKLSRTKN